MNEKENTNILRVLETLGDQIIDVYRRKLYEGGSNASGLLGNSLSCIVKTEDGIYDFLCAMDNLSAKEMANHLLNYVIRICNGKIRDDMTILVVGLWSLEK